VEEIQVVSKKIWKLIERNWRRWM